MKRPDPALLRLLLFSGTLIAVVVLLLVFRTLFLPLILGFALAYLFDPAVSWFERRGWPRALGIVILGLGLLVAVTGFFFYLVPAIAAQFQGLAENFPQYQKRIEEQVRPWLADLRARYPQELADLQERATRALQENFPRLATMIGTWFGGLLGNLLSGVLFILGLIFVPVFAFYLLLDFPAIRRQTRELIPLPYRAVAVARVREVDGALASFVRGQLTIALILATINATGLMILGVPLGLVVGLVAGFANLIPYMAIVVGLAPALLLSWVDDQSWVKLLGVVAVFAGAQLIEGTYLSPRILGKSINLHPVWVLLSLIVFGSLMGFFGMLIAVPLAAVIQVFVRHWVESYKASRIYQGDREVDSTVAPEG
jgi:predicted PurR-regulated permease PerM